MLKIIIPVIALLLLVIFWKKVEEFFFNKFKIKISYIILIFVIIASFIIGILLYD